MKNIILLLVLLFISCDSQSEEKNTSPYWILKTTDGRVFEVTRSIYTSSDLKGYYGYYEVLNGPKIVIYNHELLSIEAANTDNVKSLNGYQEGYKQGQIDYANDRICYIKQLTDKNEIIFIDTCKHK